MSPTAVRSVWTRTYLGAAAATAAAAGLVEKDNRLEPSLLFNTVFHLDTILLRPLFFPPGSPGPSCAGALMIAASRGRGGRRVDVPLYRSLARSIPNLALSVPGLV